MVCYIVGCCGIFVFVFRFVGVCWFFEVFCLEVWSVFCVGMFLKRKFLGFVVSVDRGCFL